jgi:hypothetical protein
MTSFYLLALVAMGLPRLMEVAGWWLALAKAKQEDIPAVVSAYCGNRIYFGSHGEEGVKDECDDTKQRSFAKLAQVKLLFFWRLRRNRGSRR